MPWREKAKARARTALEILAPIVMAALVAWGAFALAPSRGYRFKASSAYAGYQTRGWSGLGGPDDLFLHTKKQQDPWVDLVPTKGTTSRVQIWNRGKNSNRVLPLVLEIPDGKGGYREIARQTEPFKQTTLSFPPVKAKKIRLRVAGKKTYLHLRGVRVD